MLVCRSDSDGWYLLHKQHLLVRQSTQLSDRSYPPTQTSTWHKPCANRLLLRFYYVGRDILDLENKAAESSHSVNAWARLSSRQFSAAHGASIQLVSLSKMEPRTRNRHKPYGTRITCTRNRHKPYGTRNTAQRIGTTNTAHGIGTRITCTRITAHGIGTRNRHKESAQVLHKEYLKPCGARSTYTGDTCTNFAQGMPEPSDAESLTRILVQATLRVSANS